MLVATPLKAQRAEQPSPASAFAAWLSAGVGVSGGGTDLAAQWEGGVAYRFLAAGYQDSRSDDLSGTRRREQVVFGGARVTWGRGAVLAAGGVARGSKCRSNGEQSGTCTRSVDAGIPVFKGTAELMLAPVAGVFLSTLQPARRDIGFATYVLGIEVGRLR